MNALDVVQRLAGELERALGRRIIASGDVASQEGHLSVSARTAPGEASEVVAVGYRIEILRAPGEDGEPRTWALIFPFVAGRRVRSTDGDYVGMNRDENGAWRASGWERDVYDEWADVLLG